MGEVNVCRESSASHPWTVCDTQLQATIQVMGQGEEGFPEDPKMEDQLGELLCRLYSNKLED